MLPRLLSFIFESEARRLIPYDVCALSLNRQLSTNCVLQTAVDILGQEPPFSSSDRAVICRRVNALFQHYIPERPSIYSCPSNGFCRASNQTGLIAPFLLLKDIARLFISEFDGMPAFKFWQANKRGETTQDRQQWRSQVDAEKKPELWRSLSLRIDTTPVLAVFFSESRVPLTHPAVENEVDIRLNDQMVLKRLEKGLVETHLHLSAGFSFRSLIRRILEIPNGHLMQLTRSLMENDRHDILSALAGFLAARYILVEKFFIGESDAHHLLSHPRSRHDHFASWNQTAYIFGLNCRSGVSCSFLEELRRWHNDCSIEEAASAIGLYSELVTRMESIARRYSVQEGSSLYMCLYNDTAFLTYIFNNLEGRSLAVQMLLLYYIQAKNQLFRFMVKEHGIYGFHSFRDRFVGMKCFKMDKASCISHLVSDDLLRKVEVRISIDGDCFYGAKRKIIEILEEQKAILESAKSHKRQKEKGWSHVRGRNPLQIGIVNHFVKPNIRPSPRPNDCLFSYLKRHTVPYLHSTWHLLALLESIPELSEYLVGIDVANTETSLPNFCFYPCISILREAWRLGGRKGNLRKSMSLTFHAGEYFYDPTACLFSIDELLDTIVLRSGDRLGHGLVTGMDLEWWCQRSGPFVVNRNEDLLARLWLWKMANDGLLEPYDLTGKEAQLFLELGQWLAPPLAGRFSHHKELVTIWSALSMRHEAFHFLLMHDPEVRSILGLGLVRSELARIRKRVSPEIFSMFQSLVASEPVQFGMCNGSTCYNLFPQYLTEQMEVLRSYFFSTHSFREGLKSVHRNYSDQDIRHLQRLQRFIRRKLSERGIVIEANLTSNWVIAGMTGMKDHPIFTWYSQETEDGDHPNVVCSLNTDNPAVFNTRLEMEYALLFNAAINRGYSRSQAMELLEKIIQNSMLSCFVRRDKVDIDSQLKELESMIDRLERLPEPSRYAYQ